MTAARIGPAALAVTACLATDVDAFAPAAHRRGTLPASSRFFIWQAGDDVPGEYACAVRVASYAAPPLHLNRLGPLIRRGMSDFHRPISISCRRSARSATIQQAREPSEHASHPRAVDPCRQGASGRGICAHRVCANRSPRVVVPRAHPSPRSPRTREPQPAGHPVENHVGCRRRHATTAGNDVSCGSADGVHDAAAPRIRRDVAYRRAQWRIHRARGARVG